MSKLMPVDVLSSIKGAKSSEAVNKLFNSIKNAPINNSDNNNQAKKAVNIDDLRDDVVEESSEITKQIIKENFPKEKNGFLVVSKVIES